MKIQNQPFPQEKFALSWWRFLLQGLLIMLVGVAAVLSSLVNANVGVISALEFPWLPLIGIIILLLGLQELLEAFFSKVTREFHQNLQVGILDTVIGALIILSGSGDYQRLGMMVAAFLIVRGSVRIALVRALGLPHAISTSLFGLISVVFGLLLFFEWPTAGAWFISLSLSVEVTFRGWAMMMFGLWVRKRNLDAERTD